MTPIVLTARIYCSLCVTADCFANECKSDFGFLPLERWVWILIPTRPEITCYDIRQSEFHSRAALAESWPVGLGNRPEADSAPSVPPSTTQILLFRGRPTTARWPFGGTAHHREPSLLSLRAAFSFLELDGLDLRWLSRVAHLCPFTMAALEEAFPAWP